MHKLQMNFLTIPFIGRLPARENTILRVKEEERYLVAVALIFPFIRMQVARLD